jgi:hypothetical protein
MKWVLIVVLGLVAVVAVICIIGTMLPQGHVATRRARFRQSPEAIWKAITGPPNWRPDVKSFEELPAEAGRRRWREISGNGKITFEEVSATPFSRLEVRIADRDLPFAGGWTYEIEPAAGGATLRVTERGEVYNPVFRFISRFIMGHTRSLEQYLTALGTKFQEQISIEP